MLNTGNRLFMLTQKNGYVLTLFFFFWHSWDTIWANCHFLKYDTLSINNIRKTLLALLSSYVKLSVLTFLRNYFLLKIAARIV